MSESRRTAREKWRQIIDGQAGSGLSVAAYCRDRQVAPASFFAWKRRLRLAIAEALPSLPAFVEVESPPSPTAQAAVSEDGVLAREDSALAIEVGLPGRRHLRVRRGFDPRLLSELIHLLEAL
jgi:hypothetical protein